MDSLYSLSDISSIVRQLPSKVTSIFQRGSYMVAGDKDGSLACWSLDKGNLRWEVALDPSVSDICSGGDFFIVAHGGRLTSVSMETGLSSWSTKLDGASDYVVCNGRSIWVTSSVYEVEIGDYTHCKITEVEKESGTIMSSHSLDSKAWALEIFGEGCMIGTGRPSPGAYLLDSDGDCRIIDMAPKLPVVKSILSPEGRISFMTSLGTAYEIDQSCKITNISDDVSCVGYLHNGDWIALSQKEYIDTLKIPQEDGQEYRSEIISAEEMTIITKCSNETNGIWKSQDDTVYWTRERDELTAVSGQDRYIILGFLSGKIFVLEKDVVSRRSTMGAFSMGNKSEMIERLRMLRIEKNG